MELIIFTKKSNLRNGQGSVASNRLGRGENGTGANRGKEGVEVTTGRGMTQEGRKLHSKRKYTEKSGHEKEMCNV